MSTNRITVRILNSLSRDLMMHLEPWGEQHLMPSGATFRVEAQGPDGDTLELEYGEDRITVYGWSGSTVSVSAIGTPEESSEGHPIIGTYVRDS